MSICFIAHQIANALRGGSNLLPLYLKCTSECHQRVETCSFSQLLLISRLFPLYLAFAYTQMLSKSSFVSLWLQPFQRHCSAGRASVSPHQASVQSREKVPLPPGKYSHARLHAGLVEGELDFSPSPGFWFLGRAAASSPRHPTTTTASPHSGQEGPSW